MPLLWRRLAGLWGINQSPGCEETARLLWADCRISVVLPFITNFAPSSIRHLLRRWLRVHTAIPAFSASRHNASVLPPTDAQGITKLSARARTQSLRPRTESFVARFWDSPQAETRTNFPSFKDFNQAFGILKPESVRPRQTIAGHSATTS